MIISLYTIYNLGELIEIIAIWFPYGLKMMSRKTLSEPQPDSAAYLHRNKKMQEQEGLLMGGGNNYSSGRFQLLPRVYWTWKLSWLQECQHMFGKWYWSAIMATVVSG